MTESHRYSGKEFHASAPAIEKAPQANVPGHWICSDQYMQTSSAVQIFALTNTCAHYIILVIWEVVVYK